MIARQLQKTGALTGPTSELERLIFRATPAIECWMYKHWLKYPAPFYASVDLRNSGDKIAPVDVNLFPGGFNNLNPDNEARCLWGFMNTVEKAFPGARGVLLVPENHTRNTAYIENVVALKSMLLRAGVQLRVGSLDPNLTAAIDVESANGTLRLEPIRRNGNRLGVDGFDPCLVLLNNDLSSGVPDILRNIDQPVHPPLHAGWTTRRKSNHFAIYADLATQVADLIGMDPWLINAYFSKCGSINFRERTGAECLEDHISAVFNQIRLKYKHYGIAKAPFVIVKADAGTYGMAVMTVKDPTEVRVLNRRQRKKMEMTKGRAEVREVLIQEGVYTADLVEGCSAEPVIYMANKFVIGGFYRLAPGRGKDENLNVPGSRYSNFAFDKPCHFSDQCDPQSPWQQFNAYSVIARIALAATAIELEKAGQSIEKNAPAMLQVTRALPPGASACASVNAVS